MILYNTRQVRVFNGDGISKERELLLKLFNNYSIKNFINFIKIVEIQLKSNLNLNLNLYFSKNIKNFLLDLKMVINLKKNKKLKIFLIKKFLVFYFFKFFKKYLKKLKEMKINFFSFLAKESFLSLKFNSLKSLYFNNLNLFNKSFLPSSYLRTTNNRNIFIVGEVYNFYRGSLTPFYNSKFSWFISTGLKTDVEAGDINLLKNRKTFDFFNDNRYKSIVLRLNNFKHKVNRGIKKKVRHLFYYSLSNFFGFQRFLSESKSSYNYKINNYSLLEQSFFFTKLKVNKLFNFVKKKEEFFTKLGLNKYIFRDFFYKNSNFFYGSSLNTHFVKFIFILFKSSKATLDYYIMISNEILNLRETSIAIYKSLFSFLNLKKKYNNLFKNLFKSLVKKFLFTKFKLVKHIKLKLNLFFNNLFNIIMHVFQLNLYFLKKIFTYFSKTSFFDIFFSVFLVRKKSQTLAENLDKAEISIKEKIDIHIKLLNKPYWFSMYKNFLYYLYFFIEWKINFDLFLIKDLKTNFSSLDVVKKMQKPFELLKVKWHTTFFINIKELYFFMFNFLEEILFDLKKIFYYYALKNNFLTKKLFLLLNLFIYINKFKSKDLNSEKLALSSVIKLSSFFLGKWFYYRHLQKFIDNKVDYNYSLVKPSKLLDLFKSKSFKFKTLSFSKYYRKKRIWRKRYREAKRNFRIRTKLIFDIKLKVYKYRNNLWFKKLTFYSNNILKRGLFFKQPRIPKKGINFWRTNSSIYQFIPSVHNTSLKFSTPSRRQILKKYNKHYLSSFYKESDLNFSNTFLTLYIQLNTKIKKTYSYYNFWF